MTEKDRISEAIDEVDTDGFRGDSSADAEGSDDGESRPLTVEEALDDTPSYASLEPAGPVRISAVDTRAFPEVSVRFRVGAAGGTEGPLAPDDVELHEDGSARDVSVTVPAESTADVVFVVDDLGTMLETIIGARRAIAGVVDALASAGVDARFALVTAKEAVAIAQDFTADRSALLDAVTALSGSLGADRTRHPLDVLGVATGNAADDAGTDLSSFRSAAHRVVVDVTDAPANMVDADAAGTDAPGAAVGPVATALHGFTYVEISDVHGGLDGDDATPVATAIGGAWFERPPSSVDAFVSVMTNEVAPLVATTYTATYTSDAETRNQFDGPIRLVVDDPDDGEFSATWPEQRGQ